MEIVSKPAEPKTVTVTDIDICTVAGTVGFSLWPGDSEVHGDDHWQIHMAANPVIARRAEVVTFRPAHVVWVSRRERTVELLPEAQDAARSSH